MIWLPGTGNKSLIHNFVMRKYKKPLQEAIRQHCGTPATVFLGVSPEAMDEEELERVVSTSLEETLPFKDE